MANLRYTLLMRKVREPSITSLSRRCSIWEELQGDVQKSRMLTMNSGKCLRRGLQRRVRHWVPRWPSWRWRTWSQWTWRRPLKSDLFPVFFNLPYTVWASAIQFLFIYSHGKRGVVGLRPSILQIGYPLNIDSKYAAHRRRRRIFTMLCPWFFLFRSFVDDSHTNYCKCLSLNVDARDPLYPNLRVTIKWREWNWKDFWPLTLDIKYEDGR